MVTIVHKNEFLKFYQFQELRFSLPMTETRFCFSKQLIEVTTLLKGDF